MTDIFFSYSSKDRERVRPVRDALAAQGFDVFWDQEVPTGLDWDRWIRDHLNKSKCALVFWSINSIASDNVRHEATVAKQHGKLVPVMLDALTAEQFPMGLYAVQGANLASWTGDDDHVGWSELRRQIETKLTPLWVRRHIDTLDAELVAERARRETAERRDRTLRDQIVKEAQAQQELRRELDHAHDEIAALKARLQSAPQGQGKADPRVEQLAKQLAAARDEVHTLEAANDELQTKIKALQAAPPRSSSGPPAWMVKAGALPDQAAPVDKGSHAKSSDRRAIAIAAVFALAVPFVLFGFAVMFEVGGWSFLGLYEAVPSGVVAAGLLIPTVAIVYNLRRHDPLGSTEFALYWLGCAIAFAAAACALFQGMRWGMLAPGGYGESGLLFGSLCVLAFAPIAIRWRKQPLAGADIALYWIGCALAVAASVFALSASAEWTIFGPYGWVVTAFFASAAAAIITGAIVVWRRWAVIDHVEAALYWCGTSLAVAVATPALLDGMGFGLYVAHPLAALLVLASGALLVRRRQGLLGTAEVAIYGLGMSLATAVLITYLLYLMGIGVPPDTPGGVLLMLVITLGIGAGWSGFIGRSAKTSNARVKVTPPV